MVIRSTFGFGVTTSGGFRQANEAQATTRASGSERSEPGREEAAEGRGNFAVGVASKEPGNI
jgi:hypothetical protein